MIGTDGTFDLDSEVTVFLFTGGWLNIILALFNLLPIPPLDGSAILTGISSRFDTFFRSQQAQVFGLFIILALIFTGIVGFIFSGAQEFAAWYVSLFAGVFA